MSWLPGSVHGGSSPTWLLNTTGQIFSSLHLGPVFCFPLNCRRLKLLFRIHSSKKEKNFTPKKKKFTPVTRWPLLPRSPLIPWFSTLAAY